MTALAKYAIRQTEWALRDFVMVVESLPADKLEWKPTPQSKHVLEQVQECAFVNHNWAGILRAREWTGWTQEDYDQFRRDHPTIESALQVLKDATEEYLKAVEEVPEGAYDKVIETPWPEPWTKTTVGGAMLHAHYHLCYHEGQITYIATMCES